MIKYSRNIESNNLSSNSPEIDLVGSSVADVVFEEIESNNFEVLIKSVNGNRKSYNTDIQYKSDDKISDYIYNTFTYDEISYDRNPKTKYIIENIAKDIGVEKIDYSLLNILSKKIYISNREDEIIKFLALLSSLDLTVIPLTSITAMTGLSNHKSDSVKESVLGTIESWEWPGALQYLDKMEDFKRPYLQKYKEDVMDNLRGLL